VILHELTGFHALVTRYQEPRAIRKRRLLTELASPALAALLTGPDRPGKAQGPDLIMVDPVDTSRWFFCETKKTGEGFTNSQRAFFPEIARRSGRPIHVLTMEPGTAAAEECWINRPARDQLLARIEWGK